MANDAGYDSYLDWVQAEEDSIGYPICGALRTTTNTPCTLRAGWGTPATAGRCKWHGGASTPGGPDHPAWKHGRSSRYQIPENAVERAAAEARDLLDLSPEVELLHIRIAELFESMPPVYSEHMISRAITGMREAIEGGAHEEILAACDALESALDGAERGLGVWEEIRRTIDMKAKVVRAESDRRAREFGPMSWLDLAIAIDRIKRIMFEHVSPADRTLLLKEFALEFPAMPATVPALQLGDRQDDD